MEGGSSAPLISLSFPKSPPLHSCSQMSKNKKKIIRANAISYPPSTPTCHKVGTSPSLQMW